MSDPSLVSVVLDWLKGHVPTNASGIARATGIPHRVTLRILEDLRDQNRILWTSSDQFDGQKVFLLA